MSENKVKIFIEDWYNLFNGDDGPTCTFIESDGSLRQANTLTINQVEDVLYQHEDVGSWDWNGTALVLLKDGNFAYLTAWSETTFSDANHFIAESLETLFKYAMSPEEEKTIRATL